MKHRLAILTLAASALLSGAAHAQRSGEPVTLNFANAEIEAVARTMAAITGRNVVVDPRVKGTMNLVTDRPVPPAAASSGWRSRRSHDAGRPLSDGG